jgi:hypothetical protein
VATTASWSNLGFEVLRLGAEMRVRAAADITVVNPTGSTIGFLVRDDESGFYHFLPFDPIPSPAHGPAADDGPGRRHSAAVVFVPFCPAQHGADFRGVSVDGTWYGGAHPTRDAAVDEAGQHTINTGHEAVVRRYPEG